jgi:hypothetical protein
LVIPYWLTDGEKYREICLFPDLRPRFPLFGGWKTHYLVGYNVPSYEYLFYKGKLLGTFLRVRNKLEGPLS